MTPIITTTLTITMSLVLNMQECGCDGLCGVGAAGEQGPYQILSFTQMEKLGYPQDDSFWWMDFYAARPAVQAFLDWMAGAIPCRDPRWTFAAYNWGIGNVLRLISAQGCDLSALSARVYKFANLNRGRACYQHHLDDWQPMLVDDVWRRNHDKEGMDMSEVERREEVQKALAELYEAFYRVTSDVIRYRADVEAALARLMVAYNAWLN